MTGPKIVEKCEVLDLMFCLLRSTLIIEHIEYYDNC